MVTFSLAEKYGSLKDYGYWPVRGRRQPVCTERGSPKKTMTGHVVAKRGISVRAEGIALYH